MCDCWSEYPEWGWPWNTTLTLWVWGNEIHSHLPSEISTENWLACFETGCGLCTFILSYFGFSLSHAYFNDLALRCNALELSGRYSFHSPPILRKTSTVQLISSATPQLLYLFYSISHTAHAINSKYCCVFWVDRLVSLSAMNIRFIISIWMRCFSFNFFASYFSFFVPRFSAQRNSIREHQWDLVAICDFPSADKTRIWKKCITTNSLRAKSGSVLHIIICCGTFLSQHTAMRLVIMQKKKKEIMDAAQYVCDHISLRLKLKLFVNSFVK